MRVVKSWEGMGVGLKTIGKAEWGLECVRWCVLGWKDLFCAVKCREVCVGL